MVIAGQIARDFRVNSSCFSTAVYFTKSAPGRSYHTQGGKAHRLLQKPVTGNSKAECVACLLTFEIRASNTRQHQGRVKFQSRNWGKMFL